MPTDLLEQRFERALREAPADKRAIEICLRRLNESRAYLATLLRSGYVVRLKDKFVLRPRRASDGMFTEWAALLKKEASTGRLFVDDLARQTIDEHSTRNMHGDADGLGVVVTFRRASRQTARIDQEEYGGDRQGKREHREWATTRESSKWRHPFDSKSG